MLDINYIRNHPEEVKQNIKNRGVDPKVADIDKLLVLDKERRDLTVKIEKLRHERTLTAQKRDIEKGKKIKEKLKGLEEQLESINSDWQKIMDWIPNLLAHDVPIGAGEDDNVEIKAWTPQSGYLSSDKLGKKDFSKQWMPSLKFSPKDHLELGKSLDIIDVEQSAKVSGSRFYYLKNEGTLLLWAIFELLKKKLLSEGFIPMVVPLLVKERALYGTSHFPGDADQVYKIENKYVEEQNDIYLVGSSEPPLFAYYMDETLSYKNLPQKFFAVTSCFRTEVGSWGKDVRGIKRVHQFDKLEMDAITTPEESDSMQKYLLGINEWLLQILKLPYHIILMCGGDAGYAATYKKYDFEFWLPSQNAFTELGSNTNASDFQARRLNTKFIDKEGNKEYVHHINDTGVSARVIIAILENYQNPDGSVTIPEILREYVGKDIIEVKSQK